MEREAAVQAVFKPVRAPTMFEETVERLGTAIRLGLLLPGSRLPPERELAEELQISRSTLRQALTTLEQSGHLTQRRGRSGGTFVAVEPPLTTSGEASLSEAAWATLDHRVAVEAGAVLLAAERGRAADLERLDDLVDRMATAEDFEDYRLADIRFHIGIAETARSPRLVQAMTEVQGQMSGLISIIAHPDQVLTHSNEQHRRIVAYLRDSQGVKAVALMRDHIEGTEHILAGLLPKPV
jgi:DNA-binding FadR family transcriptional regulator